MENNNPYDFILNSEKPKKNQVNLVENPKLMIGFIVFSILVILAAFAGLSAVMGGGSKSQKKNFITMELQQTEIIRIAELADDNKSSSDTTKNIALNAKLTILSEQQTTTALLAKRGQKKIDPKLLATSKNKKTDMELEEASRQNKFNELYRTTLKNMLKTHQASIQNAYESGSANEKKLLKTMYDNNATLLETVK